RDRLPRDLPLPPARRAPVPAPAAAARDHLAAALADLPDHAGSRPDQAAGRSLLASAHVPLLPLRDPADPEPAEPYAALHAAVVPPGRRPLQSPHRARGAVVRVLAALGTPRRGHRHGHVPGVPDLQRQPLVPQLAHAGADPRLLRRRLPLPIPSGGAGS